MTIEKRSELGRIGIGDGFDRTDSLRRAACEGRARTSVEGVHVHDGKENRFQRGL